MLIAGWSLLFFGESLGALAWTGIAISVLGLVAMALMARGNDESKALPWTLLAMLAMTGRLRRSAGRWMPRARPGAMALLVGSLCVGLAYALVIHAGIDGVVTGMPDHGLTAKILGDFGFKHVFAGHYHNHKVLEHGVVSIGATTHHSWRDVDSKAGFLLVEGDKIQFHATHAPRFIDISGWDEDDIKMEAPGNFIRFRGPPMDAKDLEELRKWLSTLGAKGVQVDVAKVSASARSAASPASGARSLDDSVLAFVDASASVPATIDKAKLKQRAADVLNRARAVEEA